MFLLEEGRKTPVLSLHDRIARFFFFVPKAQVNRAGAGPARLQIPREPGKPDGGADRCRARKDVGPADRPQRKQPGKRVPADHVRFFTVRAQRQNPRKRGGSVSAEGFRPENGRRFPRRQVVVPIRHLKRDQAEILPLCQGADLFVFALQKTVFLPACDLK